MENANLNVEKNKIWDVIFGRRTTPAIKGLVILFQVIASVLISYLIVVSGEESFHVLYILPAAAMAFFGGAKWRLFSAVISSVAYGIFRVAFQGAESAISHLFNSRFFHFYIGWTCRSTGRLARFRAENKYSFA